MPVVWSNWSLCTYKFRCTAVCLRCCFQYSLNIERVTSNVEPWRTLVHGGIIAAGAISYNTVRSQPPDIGQCICYTSFRWSSPRRRRRCTSSTATGLMRSTTHCITESHDQSLPSSQLTPMSSASSRSDITSTTLMFQLRQYISRKHFRLRLQLQ